MNAGTPKVPPDTLRIGLARRRLERFRVVYFPRISVGAKASVSAHWSAEPSRALELFLDLEPYWFLMVFSMASRRRRTRGTSEGGSVSSARSAIGAVRG